MTFKDNGTDIKFYLTWNGDVKMSGHLLDFKEDICVTVPIPKIGPLVGICLFFSKMVNEIFSLQTVIFCQRQVFQCLPRFDLLAR